MTVGFAVLIEASHAPAVLWTIPICVGAVLLLMLPLLGLLNAPHVIFLKKLPEDGIWAHWTYDEAEWRAANRLETGRELRSARYPVLGIAGVGAVLALFGIGTPLLAGIGVFAVALSIGMGAALVLCG